MSAPLSKEDRLILLRSYVDALGYMIGDLAQTIKNQTDMLLAGHPVENLETYISDYRAARRNRDRAESAISWIETHTHDELSIGCEVALEQAIALLRHPKFGE